MNNVQEMVMGQRGRSVVGVVMAAWLLVPQACARTHSPQGSTETGNPPVIDAERVALRMQDGEPHVVGEKGAVKPGGVTITARNLVSDKSASSTAAKDGSFDVKVPGGASDGFSIQASNGDAESKPVFVTQTSAVEGDGKSGALSCEQQTQLAKAQTQAAVDAADTSCTQDDDCVDVETTTVCWSTCSWEAVSRAGKTLIESVVASIDDGPCSGYRDADCETGLRFCPSDSLPHLVSCVQGHCMRVDGDGSVIDAGAADGGALSCEQRLERANAQLVQAENGADRICTSDNDCVVGPFDTECFQGCSGAIVSTKGRTQVQDAIASINAGVCAGYQDGGCALPNIDCGPPGTPVCKQGRCQAALTCAERSNAASAELRNATALADNTCSTNADCVYAPVGIDCFAGCSSPAISVTGEAQLQADIAAINAGVCAGFTDDGCSVVLPPCPAPPDMPTCNQGRCAPGPSCDVRVAAAQARLDHVAAAADKACTKDADCDYPTSGVQCSLPCGGGSAILSATGRAQYDAAVAELNAGVCKNFLNDGCPMSGTTCMAPPTPICKQGECAGATAP